MRQRCVRALSIVFLIVLSAGSATAYPVDDSVTVITADGDTLVAHRYEVQERWQTLKLWVGQQTYQVDRIDILAAYSYSRDVSGAIDAAFDGAPLPEFERGAIETSENIRKNRWIDASNANAPMFIVAQYGRAIQSEATTAGAISLAFHIPVTRKFTVALNYRHTSRVRRNSNANTIVLSGNLFGGSNPGNNYSRFWYAGLGCGLVIYAPAIAGSYIYNSPNSGPTINPGGKHGFVMQGEAAFMQMLTTDIGVALSGSAQFLSLPAGSAGSDPPIVGTLSAGLVLQL